jgi:hypothetical protein
MNERQGNMSGIGKAGTSIKENFENHPVPWGLGLIVAGFLAGIGVYHFGLDFTHQKVISEDQLIRLQNYEKEAQNVKIQKNELGAPVTAQPEEKKKIEPIGLPKQNKLGILMDISHGQAEWRKSSIFKLAENREILNLNKMDEYLDIKEIKDRRQIRADAGLASWRGLILGIPYHQMIEKNTIDEIVKWVREG